MSQFKGSSGLSSKDYSLAEGLSIFAAGEKAEGMSEIRGSHSAVSDRMTAAVGGHP